MRSGQLRKKLRLKKYMVKGRVQEKFSLFIFVRLRSFFSSCSKGLLRSWRLAFK